MSRAKNGTVFAVSGPHDDPVQHLPQYRTCAGTGRTAENLHKVPGAAPDDLPALPPGRKNSLPAMPRQRVYELSFLQRHGVFSHITHLSAQGLTYFEFDRSPLPPAVANLVDKEAPALVVNGHIQVSSEAADAKNGALGLSYEMLFPYGEIIFSLRKKRLKAHLFGYKARLLDLPPFLNSLIAPGLRELEAAAVGQGNVAGKIKKASRYRLLGLALVNAAQSSTRKTTNILRQKYPIGLKKGTLTKITDDAARATAHITRKPRYYGLAAGLVLTGLLYALYYLGPVQGLLAPYIPNKNLSAAMDGMLVVIGCVLTTFSIQMSARKALRDAIGHLVPDPQRKKLVPRTHSSRWIGYAGSVALYFIVIEVAAHVEGAAPPVWYGALRNMLGL